MTKPTRKITDEGFDSIAFCIAFWEGAFDPEDEIDLCLREIIPVAHRTSDDLV